MNNIDFKIADEAIDFEAKELGVPELLELDFWRKLMSHKYDRSIDLGGLYELTETVIVSDDHREIAAFVIDKEYTNGEAEIILVHRETDGSNSWALLRTRIRFNYVDDPYSAYHGMKKGFKMRVFGGYDSTTFANLDAPTTELLKKAVRKVLTSEDFGLPGSIYY